MHYRHAGSYSRRLRREIVQAARYVVDARPPKFHYVGCHDNTLAASLGTHVPLDEHIHV